jgi:flavin-dependent dehydrogenase
VKYDVIIVGAGPAGSTAAFFLAKKGFKVLFIDKHKFPRVKPCGGGIPMAAFKRFSYIEKYNLVDSYCYGGFFEILY